MSTISDYAELLNKNIGTVLSVYYKKKKLLVLKDELDNWNKLLGSDGSKEESQVVSYQTAEEDTEREEYTENGSSIQGNGVVVKYQDKGNKLSFFYEISFTAEDLKKQLPNNITEQKGTTGIFYIKESQYIRQTVEEFRGEKV